MRHQHRPIAHRPPTRLQRFLTHAIPTLFAVILFTGFLYLAYSLILLTGNSCIK